LWPPQAIALTFELPEGSLADAEAALEIATALGDERLVISAQIHLGCALTLRSRYEETIERLRHAVDETARTDDLVLRGQALNNCAEAEKRAGRLLEAIEHQLSSLEIDRKLGDNSCAVVSLNNLAELNLGLGELDEAERYALESIELAGRRQFTFQEAVSRLTFGRTLRAKGDLNSAREQFALSLGLYHRARP
jgi:tetratricopeptide (TPR) repeat protein